MNSTNVREYLDVGIYAVYERGYVLAVPGVAGGIGQDYFISEIVDHLTAIEGAWAPCLAIATYRRLRSPRERDFEQVRAENNIRNDRAMIAQFEERRQTLGDEQQPDPQLFISVLQNDIERLERKVRWLDTEPELLTRDQLYELFHDELPVLTVRHLRIGSPFILDLVVHGGPTATAVAAIYMLFRAMRDPKDIGAWLPRLVAGWHEGMHEADEAKRLRLHDSPVVSEFIEVTQKIPAWSSEKSISTAQKTRHRKQRKS